MAEKFYNVAIKVVSQKGHCAAGHKVGDQWVTSGLTPPGMAGPLVFAAPNEVTYGLVQSPCRPRPLGRIPDPGGGGLRLHAGGGHPERPPGAQRFLELGLLGYAILSVALLGIVPEDEYIIVSTNRGEPAVLDAKTRAGQAYLNVARRLLGEDVPYLFADEEANWLDRLVRFVLQRDVDYKARN